MSRFTAEEFERAFVQVYPSQQPLSPECKVFLGFLLTNTPKDVYTSISLSMSDSNKDKINKCLNTIIGHDNIDDLINFIQDINNPSKTSSTTILKLMEDGYNDLPIIKVCLIMFQNKEGPTQALHTSTRPSAHTSAYPPASTPASAYPPASAPASA